MSQEKDLFEEFGYQREFKGIWIPREIWLDKTLTMMEKILFTEISSLSSQKYGCIASNKYLGLFLGIDKSGVSKLIKSLTDKGLISVEIEYQGKEVVKRIITVLGGGAKTRGGGANMQQGGGANLQGGVVQICTHSNTILLSNTNTIKEKIEKEKVNLTELMDFGRQELKKLNLDPAKFEYHLQTKIEGWIETGKDGHGKVIKNWKAKVKNIIPYLKPLTIFPKTENLTKKEFKSSIPQEEW